MKPILGTVHGTRWHDTITATQVAYHRNGVGGEGFHAVLFTHANEMPEIEDMGSDQFLGIVYETASQVSIINLNKIATHGIGMGNMWRGDVYETALRQIIAEWIKLDWKERQ